MKEISTEIGIHDSPEQVWQILTDFASYPEWNPFIRQASGEVREGAELEVQIQPPGGRGMTFRPTVLKAEPGRELRWRGQLWLPGLFDGEHIFTIEPIGTGRLRFVQREVFTGLLVPLLGALLERSTRHGFEAMNQALKDRTEELSQRSLAQAA